MSVSTANRLPPGPRDGMLGIRLVGQIKRDLLGFYERLHREYGDVAYMRLGPFRDFTFFHPDHFKEILVTKAKHFIRMRRPIDVLRQWNGNSLITTEGDTWIRQRRLVQQAFQPRRFGFYAEQMAAATRHELAAALGETSQDVDFEEFTRRISMKNIGRTMFGDDMYERAPQIGHAVHVLSELAVREMFAAFTLPDWLPLPGKAEKRWAMRTLDELVRGLIRDRQAAPREGNDLLSILLSAVDEEGAGGGFTAEEVRDQCVTIFLAGHDTTAAALTWIGWVLASQPEIARRATAEVDAVLGGREPRFEDLAKLSYLNQVIKETLRVYPPAIALFAREAIDEVEIGGVRLPRGGIVRVLTYVTHHDPRWFPEPERFMPERFAPERAEAQHPFAWLPFGAGPRVCIGNSFSLMEMTIVAAMLLQRYELSPGAGQTQPGLDAMQLSLRPRGGLRLRLAARSAR